MQTIYHFYYFLRMQVACHRRLALFPLLCPSMTDICPTKQLQKDASLSEPPGIANKTSSRHESGLMHETPQASSAQQGPLSCTSWLNLLSSFLKEKIHDQVD
eukprot:1151046-Pelagomonas_calceolata.AAC.1